MCMYMCMCMYLALRSFWKKDDWAVAVIQLYSPAFRLPTITVAGTNGVLGGGGSESRGARFQGEETAEYAQRIVKRRSGSPSGAER